MAGFDPELGEASREAGLQSGDVLQKIDNVAISSPEDVRTALRRSNGTVTVELKREGKSVKLRLSPQITRDGPKLGVLLRQGVTGIGTVTWYDPETGEFGALGHGVNDSKGDLLPMTAGNTYRASITAVQKGEVGQPGRLIGTVVSPQPSGTLLRNTAKGVFGKTSEGWEGEAVPIAEAEQVKPGEAAILCTVADGTPREYSVKILKIYPKSRENGRNLLLKVTDPALLEDTGGIVQGMSGSPILQDGKLVGAVTHVLVNDPTAGYGIFIENMLPAAS
ncbi:MAG: PDZ domain-containing protein [Firmicutes bacterium]|nr:PDZ domain-containing protein [Bacillota bacterium]